MQNAQRNEKYLPYVITLRSTVLLEKLTGPQLFKKFPAFYGIRRFITAVTSARHLSLSWATAIQSMPPQPTSWRSILILSSHLLLGLSSGLFPSSLPTKTLYKLLHSPIRATCPVYLIFLHFITRTISGEKYTSLSFLLCSFLHSLVTSSLLSSNIFLSTILSNTLSLRSPLNVRNQVSHPCKTTCKIIYLQIFKSETLKGKDCVDNTGTDGTASTIHPRTALQPQPLLGSAPPPPPPGASHSSLSPAHLLQPRIPSTFKVPVVVLYWAHTVSIRQLGEQRYKCSGPK